MDNECRIFEISSCVIGMAILNSSIKAEVPFYMPQQIIIKLSTPTFLIYAINTTNTT
jgi:hypothetical protein